MTTNKQIWRTSLKVIYHTIQFIMGVVLGVSLIAGVSVVAGYYYFIKMSSKVPQKPVYEEEKVIAQGTKSEITTEKTTDASTIEAKLPLFPGEAEKAPEPEISENAYYARVTWPQGLSLRAGPSIDSARIGGVAYNARILILEDSSDQRWQRIQIPGNKQEGWVKAGNVKPILD